MASRTSYSFQKELLAQLKDQLEIFKNEMANATTNYKVNIQNLHDRDGLMDETYEEYSLNYLLPTIEIVENLIARLESEDIAFVEKELDFLSSR
jgi:isocitrate dehydrogenase kinase/phosphatase